MFFNISNLKYQVYTCFFTFSISNLNFTQVFQRFQFELSLLHRFFTVSDLKCQFHTGFFNISWSSGVPTIQFPLLWLRSRSLLGPHVSHRYLWFRGSKISILHRFFDVFNLKSQFYTGFFDVFPCPTPWGLIACRGAQPYGSGASPRRRPFEDV